MNYVNELLYYIGKSTSSFHATAESAEMLENEGYVRLYENKEWNIRPGGRYFVTRNSSSLIAFKIPQMGFAPFKITAAHSDSPCFKIKENAELTAADKYVKLNTEAYGGGILYTWLDRPLSVAGRVLVDTERGIEERLVDFDRDMLLIPSLAIHLNKETNDGLTLKKQVDMLPLWGSKEECADTFHAMLAKQAAAPQESVLGSDLYVYNRMSGCVWGAKEEYVSAPRLDNLACAFSCLKAFIAGNSENRINVCAVFDSEEIGSLTKQGADSTFLYDTLRRIAVLLAATDEEYFRAVAGGIMISADNAHALHPNHAEKYDENNRCYMNEGVVIKYSAAQKYTTDAVSGAYFRKICQMADVPYQLVANHSDIAGGSTLGNLSNAHVSINMVDIGIGQLSMHSSYETMGASDVEYMIRALTMFYDKEIDIIA